MKAPILLSGLLVLVLAAAGGAYLYQNGLVPVPLTAVEPLYVPPSPDFGQDQASLVALLPAGPGLETFLRNQSDLTLLAPGSEGGYAGQLLSGLQRSRNGRRWRLTLRNGVRLQAGGLLDAARASQAIAGEATATGGNLRVLDARTLELRFPARKEGVPGLLAQWRIPGTGPFVRQGWSLSRFDGFLEGRAGIAGLRVESDPALMESHAWAEGLASGRWAWAVFPGGIAPEDMAVVRRAPYDEVHLAGGGVWFVSQKLRRFHPGARGWAETRLFGVWQGEMNLPGIERPPAP